MRTEPLSTKLTEAEEAVFQAVQADNPMVSRAQLATLLMLLGVVRYWQLKATREPLDPAKVLVEAQRDQKKHQPKEPKKA